MSEACAECNGTGKICYSMPAGDSVVTLDGVRITDMGGSGTRPCSCVKDLPEVEGNASWWTSEVVWERTWQGGLFNDVVELQVDAEVPRREDGRRVPRRGNRYFGTWLEVYVGNGEKLSLMPEDAYSLALALMAGAGACERIDDPCVDECGHWWPCGCRERDRLVDF